MGRHEAELVVNGVELTPFVVLGSIGITLLVVYLTVLKFCYNSFSLNAVLKKYQDRKSVELAYNQAYQRREDLLFHIDWAKSRGDFTDGRKLEDDLITIEKELDELDDKLNKFDFGDKRSS